MQELSQRTSQFTDSVIRRMTRVSMKYDAINLSQGFPDFDPPAAITDCLAEVAHTGPHQYAITWGAPNFRVALAAKQSPRMNLDIDPENVTEDATFEDLGIDSLDMVELICDLEEKCSVDFGEPEGLTLSLIHI